MFFKINCYIHNIIKNDIFIEINDLDEYNRYIKNLNFLYKNNIPDKLLNKIVKLKLTKKTKFDIKNINYNSNSDLIGCNIVINFSSKYYNIKCNKKILCEYSHEYINTDIYISGYTLLVNSIKNNF